DVPDGIFFIEDAFLGQYASVLYDVTPQVAPYASKIAPYKLAGSKQGGRTVGIPWDVDPVFLIYNEEIVAKAVVGVINIITYDVLITAAQTVKAKVPPCTGPLNFVDGAGTNAYQFLIESMAWQQHTGIIDAHGKLNILSPAHTKGFQFLEKV